MNLCGWENLKSGERRVTSGPGIFKPLAFSGIQILDPKIFALIEESGKFSLTDLYLRLAKTQRIVGCIDDGAVWKDMGRMTNDMNNE
jgi:NDP-sugar pyrophosphorylase family protein